MEECGEAVMRSFLRVMVRPWRTISGGHVELSGSPGPWKVHDSVG